MLWPFILAVIIKWQRSDDLCTTLLAEHWTGLGEDGQKQRMLEIIGVLVILLVKYLLYTFYNFASKNLILENEAQEYQDH